MSETDPLSTQNHDIAGLVERIDEICVEVLKSSSANATAMLPADRERIDSYNKKLLSYEAWVVSAPSVDQPKTHPRNYEISLISGTLSRDIENKALRDLVRMYENTMYELVQSQSSRLGNGLIEHDATRFETSMEKIQKFLTDYVDKEHPVDMPESGRSSPPVTQ